MHNNKDDFRRAFKAFGDHQAPERRLSSAEKEELWARINRGIRRGKGRIRKIMWLKVAAAVFVLAALGGWLLFGRTETSSMEQMVAAARLADSVKSDSIQVLTANAGEGSEAGADVVYHTVVVPIGERTLHTLADSTRIWLNSGSKLVYPDVFKENERQVYLEGEAYFDVQHHGHRPFFVQTRDFEIKVLGTEFNVSAYPDDEDSNVVLVEGSIELSAGRDRPGEEMKTLLTPHEIAVYHPAEKDLEVSNTAVEEYVSWRTGYVVFKNTPLSDILKKLQRYYRVEIELESASVGAQTFTGPLDLGKKIEEVMDIICLTTSLVYQQQEDKIVLKENK